MSEEFLNHSIEQVYEKLESNLLKDNCRIVEHRAPVYLLVQQGSLFGIFPKSAKKIVHYHLSKDGLGTMINSFTQISSDWKNLTLWGCVLAAAFAGFFFWISFDIRHILKTSTVSFWSWLAVAFGYPDLKKTMFMVNLTEQLAFFLLVIIVIEILIVLHVYRRKNVFAQETLHALKER